MGTRDVIEWLIDKRKKGDHGYFTKNQIQKDIGFGSLCRDLKKLWKYDLIEIKHDFLDISRSYRAKIKTVERKNSGGNDEKK